MFLRSVGTAVLFLRKFGRTHVLSYARFIPKRVIMHVDSGKSITFNIM